MGVQEVSAKKPCRCHKVSKGFCAFGYADPYWCGHQVAARRAAAAARGESETVAALGGRFDVTPYLDPDAQA